jgi:hypothetical protein
MIESICKQCGRMARVGGSIPRVFCNRQCKWAWERVNYKPVSREWLYQKYIVEKLSANDIARIVHRDSKGVWKWLRSFGIPTRPRGLNSATWRKKGEPSSFKGRKHKPESIEIMRAKAIASGRVPYDPKVGPPFKGKRGAEIPSWRGGVTPLRQKFYSSPEWKAVVSLVWKRDDATCQRCGRRNIKGERFAFDIHHIVSFEYEPLRAELSNLVLLCQDCHYWVHSSENIDKRFIKEIRNAA